MSAWPCRHSILRWVSLMSSALRWASSPSRRCIFSGVCTGGLTLPASSRAFLSGVLAISAILVFSLLGAQLVNGRPRGAGRSPNRIPARSIGIAMAHLPQRGDIGEIWVALGGADVEQRELAGPFGRHGVDLVH